MIDKIINNNSVTIVGKVVAEKKFSHEMYGEGFYVFEMEIPRLSDYSDILPVTISERLLVDMDISIGRNVVIEGQLRSYNRYHNGHNKLVLTIFARDGYMLNEEEYEEKIKKPNEIYLNGFICKKPVYRTTPFGREITDLLVAVNRPYNKSDYIPTITWGRNARFCENLEVGDHIKIWGRIQSREYQKHLSDGKVENKKAYEVSVSKLEYVKDDNNRENDEDEEEKEDIKKVESESY
ncbi:single-stranded DNA-binding protein [Clostridium sp. D2Q-14]|uniref:single-stranded DNA-binding protein n=1 Tax=Anaeromonas gelatinilytica TaxID=2683194 RepID=UPI00193BF30E|nr:single-stranded DNA-binding protein [Anaeromonas gelatinilytica]MBS4535944.1 single-stranded DNA-binding protein [Anaeromonas gelatinilytica]